MITIKTIQKALNSIHSNKPKEVDGIKVSDADYQRLFTSAPAIVFGVKVLPSDDVREGTFKIQYRD